MYRPKFNLYKFNFDRNDPVKSEILKIIIEMLGKPDNDFINACTLTSFDSNKNEIVAYQVRLTDDNLSDLKRRLNEKGIDFTDEFAKDYRHFHISVDKKIIQGGYFMEVEDEGIAYERDDCSWDVYYVGGYLERFLGIGREQFIFNISNNEINCLENIKLGFEKWVNDQWVKMRHKG